MSDILHGKRITTVSYYDGLETSTKQEIEVSLLSSREDILKDVIESMSVVSRGETNRLTLDIEINSKGRYRLIKRYASNN